MKTTLFLFLIVTCMQLTPRCTGASVAGPNDLLWFSLTPSAQHAGMEHHKGGQGNRPGGHAGHESEHRPSPVRTYWLSSCSIEADAKAYAMQPEGIFSVVPIKREGHNVSVSIKTPFGDGPFHGANNVYLVDKYVRDGALVLRTAKWVTIHHNCGWGHDQKFNEKRMMSLDLSEIPLEITVDGLWDKNFHSTVMSGDRMNMTVYSYGKPAAGVSVDVISDRGWRKILRTDQNGRASFQMVRDYYPESWSLFNPRKPGKFKITADYETDLNGNLAGSPYSRALMTSTFSWRYYPGKHEYSSYVYGLLVAVFFMTFSAFGIFIYRGRRSKAYRDIQFDE